ncbi:SusC/RagA family TonB-linked outer membrane protein [Niabella ginsenosidivorans]|uniref:SusC/RagA family TonB-linked outer membrane protein n=1 Tax=Niabella ginsenosidivorans TaxID=1176587 RepID=A0A1A9I7R4_9BACT|nr:TonB-dependent receptor [Niabella ginsenosidivorans]ANH82702.1 SusC/RagA family TonB-linked outer membrane protein [Niabella ginsenosidivorans]
MNSKPTSKCYRHWCILFCLAAFLCFCGPFHEALALSAVYKPPINGTVKDTAGMPIVGASVKVKGSDRGTVTNEQGAFTIEAAVNDILEISAVGYVPVETVVGPAADYAIVLKPATHSMDEIVVIGYGAQKKSSITGAVSSIAMNKVSDIPVTNLSNALAGRAAGVTVVNSSGLAGASSNIRVRGSFGEPVYVIDGIIKDKAAFDALDANEIDQMSILKDAAAASVYGVQAGNGVVVITTKRGSPGKPVFGAQTSYTTSRPTQTLLANLSTATDELIYQNRVTQWNNEYNGKNDPLPNDQTIFDYFKDRSYNVNDWVWRNPSSQKYMINVNGGNDRITYYSMLSYTKEKGSYINLDYKKFNLRTNVTAKISNAISLNMNLAAAQQNADRFYWPFTGDDDYNVGDFYRVTFNWPKLFPFYLNADGTVADQITDYPVQPAIGSWQLWNVVDMVQGDRYINTRRRQFNPILTLDIKLDQFIKGLSTKLVGNYEANDYMRKWFLTYQHNYKFISADPSNNPYVPAPPDPSQVNIFTFSQNQPFLRYNIYTGWKYQLDWYLNYDRKFGAHAVNAMAVFEQADNKRIGATATGYDPVTSIDQMFAYSTSAGNRYGDALEYIDPQITRQAWIGRANYSYANRYLVDFSFRYDGTVLAAKGERWGFFPSGSVAWRVSQESFFRDHVSWINELKLRAGYGSTGNLVDVNNNLISSFLYTNTFTNAGGYIFGNTYYTNIAPGPTPVPGITWATNYETNLGLDFALLQNRLSGTIDAFKKKKKNILGARTITLPVTYGQNLAPENYAAQSFRGLEFSLQWQDKIGQLSYSVYGNLGYAKDKWDMLDPSNAAYYPGQPQSFRYPVGQPNNRIFGFEAEGLIRTQAQLDDLIAKGYNYYGRKPYLGAILYKDIRGQNFSPTPDGRIDDNDITLLSNNGFPRINFGFGFNVQWKGLSIDALMQGVGAYDRMISNLDGQGMRQWGGSIRPYYPIWTSDVWTPENPDARYPRPTGQNWAESGGVASTFWMRNGSYLRLRNLNIGYELPAKWVNRIGVEGAQLFLNGTNVFTFSKMKEFHDPEQDVYDSYPIMKTFTAGINVRF